MSQSSASELLRDFLEKNNLGLVVNRPQIRFTEDGAMIVEKPTVSAVFLEKSHDADRPS